MTKPKTARAFGLEIGMTETGVGKQIVIVDRESDLFVVWRDDNEDTSFFERTRTEEGKWNQQRKDADHFLRTGEWPTELRE